MIYKETRKAGCPPKAEATSSTLVGCTKLIKGLSGRWRKPRQENPPEKSSYEPLVFTDRDRERFWEKVETGDLFECWPWKGGKSGFGYGRFKICGRLHSSHRIAYEMTYGPIPSGGGYHGTVIMHSCDNAPCCNPLHLSPGTMKENAIDMARKGRGALNMTIKVTEETVSAIREDPRAHRVIAADHGVCRSYVSKVKRGVCRSS